MELINTLLEQLILANGSRGNNMDKALCNLPMVQDTKANG